MTKHYENILKETVKNEFYNLPRWQQNVIANDTEHLTQSFQWFNSFVKGRALAIYEDETRWENEASRWPNQFNETRIAA